MKNLKKLAHDVTNGSNTGRHFVPLLFSKAFHMHIMKFHDCHDATPEENCLKKLIIFSPILVPISSEEIFL